jgi:hypothetical protein
MSVFASHCERGVRVTKQQHSKTQALHDKSAALECLCRDFHNLMRCKVGPSQKQAHGFPHLCGMHLTIHHRCCLPAHKHHLRIRRAHDHSTETQNPERFRPARVLRTLWAPERCKRGSQRCMPATTDHIHCMMQTLHCTVQGCGRRVAASCRSQHL